MDLGIAGRRAAVAGASKGLGLAVARALAAEGVHIAIGSRSRERIEAAAASIGPSVVPLVADVSGAAGGAAFVDAAANALGGVDILVANAGGPPPGGFADQEPAAYEQAIELNCLSAIGMCGAAVPAMRAAGWGRVLAITSVVVRRPSPILIVSATRVRGSRRSCVRSRRRSRRQA